MAFFTILAQDAECAIFTTIAFLAVLAPEAFVTSIAKAAIIAPGAGIAIVAIAAIPRIAHFRAKNAFIAIHAILAFFATPAPITIDAVPTADVGGLLADAAGVVRAIHEFVFAGLKIFVCCEELRLLSVLFHGVVFIFVLLFVLSFVMSFDITKIRIYS